MPYLRLVYSQLEYPFETEQDTPIQLHTIGISLINSLCKELVVTIHKPELVYRQHYEDGQLKQEETEENPEHRTGTTVEAELDADLLPGEIGLRQIEEWLAEIKSMHKGLHLSFNGREY